MRSHSSVSRNPLSGSAPKIASIARCSFPGPRLISVSEPTQCFRLPTLKICLLQPPSLTVEPRPLTTRMQDDAVWAALPIVGVELSWGAAVIAEGRRVLAVGGGGACTRNVRRDIGVPVAGRFFRPLIFSLSLTVLTNLVQTFEVDGWTEAVM